MNTGKGEEGKCLESSYLPGLDNLMVCCCPHKTRNARRAPTKYQVKVQNFYFGLIGFEATQHLNGDINGYMVWDSEEKFGSKE